MRKSTATILVAALISLSGLAASPASLTDESENYRLLQAMPRERRVALLANLDRFEKLDSSERTRIRRLNDEIARKDPVEQLKYRSLMRRYQLWVGGLTTDQQNELREIEDPEARFELAIKFRKSQQQAILASRQIFGIRTGYYSLLGPFEAAHLLRVWHAMPANERYALETREPRGRIEEDIREYGRTHQVKHQLFPPKEERHYETVLEANPDFKKQLTYFADRVEVSLKKDEPARSKGEAPPTRFKNRYTTFLTEFLYFEEHKPRPVSQSNLEKFANFCPGWFQSMLDPLSPEDARNYLTIVYRQIFPEPSEINADWKPARQKTVAVPGSPRPAPKRAGPQGPI